uniref:Presenilin n=1 Tax=Albugo laibachii Nc14 TaxID=890382 RepID=F0W9T2_9STRA|nr:presenilinlike protein putative [Albugo laibachii Nc14]|eukprot:CCA17900.1 presenilinlike protein putative [Albugo laibachii Nc14]
MSSWFGCNQNVQDKPDDQRRLLEHRYGDPDREYDAPTSHPEELATYEDFQHAIGSFYAVVAPVTLTMILASLFSIEIVDPTTAQQVANTYLVYKPQKASTETNGMKIEEALINAVVIVSFFLVATFGIVFCYKFRCTNILIVYMMASSVMLLGFLGGHLLLLTLTQVGIMVDAPSFLFLGYNFAVAGVLSIFYQKGLSIKITQSYLICTSVIMAWQFGQLPEWTTWALVTMLAFYDLCAVLTPYGPLRCLVNLVQEQGRPLPGLLYEADVGHVSLGTDGMLENELHTAARNANSPQPKAIAKRSYYQCESDHTILTMQRERSDDAEERMKTRLVSFFKRVDPASLQNVDALVWKYRGRETDLWRELTKRYLVEEEESNTIKLGLGDFVFYSVLVSRAARYDFCAMIGCISAILVGLGGTLYLLGLYKKALPALPISILLSVSVYFWVRTAYIPYVRSLLDAGIFG